MKSASNFLLFGLGTLKNKGCEAILDVVATQLKQNNKNNHVTVATDNYYFDKAYHLDIVDKYVSHCIQRLPEGLSDEDREAIAYAESSPFDYKNYEKVYQKKVIEEIPNSDILFSIGGDNYCYGASEWLYTIDYYAKENNKKLVLLGASIQEENLDDEFLADLKRFDLLVFREKISYDLAARFISKRKLLLIPDPAFTLPYKKIDIGLKLDNTVAINVSPIIENSSSDALDSVYKLIDYILEEEKFNILLLPHVYTEACNDLDTLKKIKEHCKDSDRINLLSEERDYSVRELKYIISKCRFVVAARTHASIAAYSSSVPTLVIGYSVKSKGIASDLFGDYKDYVIPVEQLSGENLISKFKFIVENENDIKKTLSEKMSLYKGQATSMVSVILDKLNKLPNNKDSRYSYKGRKVFACKNKSNDVRLNSTSGGVFSELARYVINEGGCVYGAAFESKSVKHIKIENENDIYKLQGSKYAQSMLGQALKNVKKDLGSGKKVLFSGTPCQVGALYSYLKKDYDNLITVSLICHGVPSKSVFDKYIARLEDKEKDKFVEVRMRNKELGVKGFNSKYVFEGKTLQIASKDDLYFNAFLKNLTLRESCFDCKFKLYGNSKSDFILGDFWGIDSILPEFNDGFGVSAVIVNSDKGKLIFEKVNEKFEFVETKLEDLTCRNTALVKSVNYNLEHYYFLEYLKKYDVDVSMKLALENVKNKELTIKNKALENDLKYKNAELEKLKSNLQQIISSKRFRFVDKMCNFFNKIRYKIIGVR